MKDKTITSRIKRFLIKRTLLPLFSLWFTFTGAGASVPTPNDSLVRFVKDIYTYNKMFPREQVYLHFDNTGYFMGETIWFKAYVVSPQGFRPTDMSRVLYVELLTPEGRVMQQQKLKIEAGQCHGQFALNELLHAGFYEVRAYTAMMLNWEDAPVFSRVFPIFNVPKEEGVYSNPRMAKQPHSERLYEQREKTPKADKLNMVFFPEGGSLVEGLHSSVFFKATDKQGNTEEVQGEVFNQIGEAVCRFSTSHDGMGRFAFTPRTGERYHAEVTTQEGENPQRFDLPTASKQGYVMSVNNLRNDHTVVQLARSEGTDSTKALGLTIMCRGRITAFKQVDWQRGLTTLLSFPKETLSEGVNQLTLFDTEGHIHAERLFFIPPAQGTKISLVGGKTEGLQPKEAVSLDFHMEDKGGRPIGYTFSLSVRDADTDTPTNGVYGGNMTTNLLLGSELKGYIHDIDYYLEADDHEHRTNLDLLLCTQGWRKYDWTEMTRPQEFEVKHHIEEGIMVVGDLTSTTLKRKKKEVEMKVFLFNEAGYHLEASALTDSLGKFAFQAEDFTGRWEMHTLTYENGKAKEMNVNLKKVPSPKGRAFGAGETTLFIRKLMSEEEKSFQPDTLMAYEEEDKQNWENLLPTIKVEAQKEWQTPEIRRWHNIIYDMEDERLMMDETGKEYLKGFWEWLMETNPHFGYIEIGPATNSLTVPAYKNRPIKFRVKYVGKDSGIIQAPGWVLQPTAPSEDGLGNIIENLTINDLEGIAISNKAGAYVAFTRDSRESDPIIEPGIDEPIETIWALDSSMDPNNPDKNGYAIVTLFVRENFFNYKDKRGHRKTKIQGFSPERQFYIPDYSSADLPDEKDFRRTLYWNPNVKTDADGNATVKFYNSPSCKRIKISTETILRNMKF